MERVQYTVKLDLTDNGFFDTGWRIKQGDSGNSEIIALVVNNGINMFNPAIIPEIVFKRPDGKSIISTMEIAGNNYKYVFVGNELEAPGTVIMDVKITDSEGRISTNSVRFECVEDTIGYDPDGSHTYNNPVSEIAQEALAKAEKSEAWAVGTVNGEPVSPEDETYHNNAKYWAEHSKGGGGGSTVEWEQINRNGLVIAKITIDGKETDVIAPNRLIYMRDTSITEPSENDILSYVPDERVGHWTNKKNTPEVMNAEVTIDGDEPVTYSGTLQTCLDGMCDHIGTLEQDMEVSRTSTTSPLTDSADDTIKAITLKGNSYKDGDRIIIPSGDVVSQNADKTESSTIHTDRPLLSVNDIRNELIIDKDGNGKFIQRVGKYIFNGNEGWYAHSSGRFYANYLPSGITSERGKDICSIATYVQDATAIGSYYFRGSTGYYFTKVKSDETLDEFKARISNALTVYALATPQEITLTSAEVEQILSLKTFDGNTYIDTDGCPFEITYNVNATIGTLYTKTEDLQKQIDEIPKGEIYSEEETVIGIWVDGSKIYRRMFTNLSPFTINTTKTDITSRFSSMYNIIKYPLRCSAMRENSPFFGDFTLWKDTGNAKLWAYAGQASELANCTTVIFEYTKN